MFLSLILRIDHIQQISIKFDDHSMKQASGNLAQHDHY